MGLYSWLVGPVSAGAQIHGEDIVRNHSDAGRASSSILPVLVIAALAFLPGGAAGAQVGTGPSAIPLEQGGGSCYVTVEAPHLSSGNPSLGLLSKIRFGCPVGAGSRTWKSWIGNMYRCTSKPDQSAGEPTWTRNNGCLSIATNSSTDDGGSITVLPGAKDATRYIPKQGSQGPQKVSGYWYIACVRGYYPDKSTFRSGSVPIYY